MYYFLLNEKGPEKYHADLLCIPRYPSNKLLLWFLLCLSKVDNVNVERKTYLSVPGYKKKVPFGQLVSFAYPVEDSGMSIAMLSYPYCAL